MNFLYPGFLFALLATAIPVIIHLFNFRAYKKVYFSNVQFLKEAEEQNASREKLKNRLILLLRILAITFLVLAFARPYFSSENNTSLHQQNLVSIYLDNSYSMEAVNKDGALLDEAKRRAKELVKLFGPNDRFQLLTNDFEGKNQRFLSAGEFIRALDGVRISTAQRSLQQVMNRQRAVFNQGRNKLCYLISDFQKSFTGQKPLLTDKDIHSTFIKLQASEIANLSVDSVWMLSAAHQENGSEKVVVQVQNHSGTDAKNIPLKLSINNQQKNISSIHIPANKTITDTIACSGLKKGWQKAILSIQDFPVTFDDTLNFSFKIEDALHILNTQGQGPSNYIPALFSGDAYFKLNEFPESNIKYADFSNYNLIILNGLEKPSSGLAGELKNYMNNGGSLLIFPDLDADINAYNQFLKALTLPEIEEIKTAATKVSRIELKHPLFSGVFEDVPKNPGLPEVKRYYRYKDPNKSVREELLSLSSGDSFFAGYPVGNGYAYLCAAGLDLKDSNLPNHPLFVPLLYRIAFSGRQQPALYYVNGHNQVLESKKITLGANQSLKLKAPGLELIPEVRQVNGKTLLYVADQIRTSGFYNLMKADSLQAVFTFNHNRAESDLHYSSVSELENLSKKNNFRVLNADQTASNTLLNSKNNAIELWKLCLILSLIFLAAEILLIRFFNTHKKIQTK